MVDGSASVELSGVGNFNKSLEFVKSLIEYFDVSKKMTNVGLAIYSNDFHQVLNFDDYYNSSDAIAAMNNVSYPSQGRQTGNALNYARHKMFSKVNLRENASNYLIFLTSGSSYDLIRTPAKDLRDRGVTVFAIGVGNDYDKEELKQVSGHDNRVYATSYDGLKDLKRELKRQICLCEF